MKKEGVDLYTASYYLPRFKELKQRMFIYNKNSDIKADFFDILPGKKQVIDLENVGREGHTFLYHIITNYDNLADHTIFCQENPHDNFVEFLHEEWDHTVGFAGFGFGFHCPCLDCNAVGIPVRGVSDVFEMVFKQPCLGSFYTVLNGCFMASKRRIQLNPKSLYERLLQILMDPDPISKYPHWNVTYHGLAAQFNYVWSSNAPYFGHVLERSWTIIMRCVTGKVCRD